MDYLREELLGWGACKLKIGPLLFVQLCLPVENGHGHGLALVDGCVGQRPLKRALVRQSDSALYSKK